MAIDILISYIFCGMMIVLEGKNCSKNLLYVCCTPALKVLLAIAPLLCMNIDFIPNKEEE